MVQKFQLLKAVSEIAVIIAQTEVLCGRRTMSKSVMQTFFLVFLCSVMILVASNSVVAQNAAPPTFSINAVRLDVNKTSIIEGELSFGSIDVAALGFRIEHNVSFIHILSIEIEGFQAYGNPDNTNGVFDVYAYKMPGFNTENGEVAKLYLLVATQREVPSEDVSLQLALRNPYIYQAGGTQSSPISQIAMTNSSLIIEDIAETTCIENEYTYRVTTSSINVRSEPGIAGQILRTAYLDETFSVIGRTIVASGAEWLKVDLTADGISEAWVFSGNLTAICAGEIPEASYVPQASTPSTGATPPAFPTTPTRVGDGPQPPPADGGSGSTNPPPTSVPPTPAPLQPTNTSVPPTISTSDSDGDGVSDSADRCPFAPPRPWQGGGDCPDTDADGVDDAGDACPTQFGTLNGCLDSDNDGVGDEADRCRYAAGDPNNGGCPPGQ
ncbi:MAG: SH3 domain-containing protein [Chloroflexota bacterium]|nr:SH3 domain-containing protein [Chloroflexota bacterium]